ncbi:ferritin, heavy subunit-like [Prorops nasuta]|uniref:ferritin, heavy subunit-like n=1 Tax=Prorops nasuta TaxID=863751 RepID=UPI0034CDC861
MIFFPLLSRSLFWNINKKGVFNKISTNNLKRFPFQKLFGRNYTDDARIAESCNTGQPTKWPSDQMVKFQFHRDIELVFNRQINAEFKAFYYYLSMAAYFGRVDVALPGFQSFFMQMHHEEHDHALQFLNYIIMRGGKVYLNQICSPGVQDDWGCPLNALKTALQLEIEISEKLVAANDVAKIYNDLNASDFIVTKFMDIQVKSVNEMAKLVSVLSGIGDSSLARFMFDKDLLVHYVKPKFNVLKNQLKTDNNK